MTNEQKLKMLKLDIGIDDNSLDELLLMYLKRAETAILNRLYPMHDEIPLVDFPEQYDDRQLEIAVYLYNKRGAEGETSHNENGISRSYESASIPNSMLSDIMSYGCVIK